MLSPQLYCGMDQEVKVGFVTGWPRIGREDALRGAELRPEVGFCGKNLVGQVEQPTSPRGNLKHQQERTF